jgi:hypothetical protein
MKQRKELKEVIEKILGSSLEMSVIHDTEEDKLKSEFLATIDLFEKVWKRQNHLEDEMGLDFSTYDDDFFKVIEGIIHFSFSPAASEAILFYIYSRYDEEDKLIPFVDIDGEEHLMANSEDLWEYLLYLTDQMMLNN